MNKLLWQTIQFLQSQEWIINSKFKIEQIGFTTNFNLFFENDKKEKIIYRVFGPQDIEAVKINYSKDTAFIKFLEK